MAKIDLSEFLILGPDLSDLLPPEEPKDKLSPPELVVMHWLRQTCTCSQIYNSQEHGATIRHTMFRRGRQAGKVYIPLLPGMDVSSLPIEVQTKSETIFSCPSCIGSRPSLPLFPDTKIDFMVGNNNDCATPHVTAWHEAHKCAPVHAKEQVLADMAKRHVEIDDLLTFRTTEIDLQSCFSDLSTVDPEE